MSVGLNEFLINSQVVQVDPKPWMLQKNLELVTEETLERVINECLVSGLYSLDLETTGLDHRTFNGRTKDSIVGVCLSPDGHNGYYIPLRHKKGDANIPLSVFNPLFEKLTNSDAVAIFHNGKFDQEFLEHNGGDPWGIWDDPKKWEDTFLLAYLRNSRSKRKGLKYLSGLDPNAEDPLERGLGMEMIELKELYKPGTKNLDFSELDPAANEAVVWYAASDAICTYKLFQLLHPQVCGPKAKPNQSGIYTLEKACIASVRWMERSRVLVDRDKVAELIRIGQREWIECLNEVYDSAKNLLGRDVKPGFFRLMQGMGGAYDAWKFDLDAVEPSFMARVEEARKEAIRRRLDPLGDRNKVRTEDKIVPSVIDPEVSEKVSFPLVYDILSAEQLGLLLRELGVQGLTVTEKSGQIKTSKAEIEKIIDKASKDFPFAGKIKRIREIQKALSTYLIALYEDSHPEDSTVKTNFNSTGVDTGRFSAPSSRRPALDGGTRFPFHGTPSTYDPNRPECLARLRECIVARPGKFIVAIDYAGEENRIVTNLSLEPMWLEEFFHCAHCGHRFDKGDGNSTPEAPPPYCPKCGEDKIGDLHTLTGLSIYGEDAINRPEWKQLRGFAKATNFALSYGGSGKAVSRSTGCDEQEGHRIKSQFDSTYTTLAAWWKVQEKYARRHGYVLTAFGRKYPVPDINMPRYDKETGRNNGGFIAKAERNAVNGPVQGTGGDIIKLAMALIFKEVKKRGWVGRVNMLLTMHDELVFEIDGELLEEAIEIIIHHMTRNKQILRFNWPVPFTTDVEIGKDWSVPWDLKKLRKKNKWPEELQPFFKKTVDGIKTDEKVSERVSHEASPAQGEEIKDQVLSAEKSPSSEGLSQMTPDAGGDYYFTVSNYQSLEYINRLASVIVKCEGGGSNRLILQTPSGKRINWADSSVYVNKHQFYILANDYGL